MTVSQKDEPKEDVLKRLSKNCHSEARCWPKNLPRCVRLNCRLLALRPILFLCGLDFTPQKVKTWAFS